MQLAPGYCGAPPAVQLFLPARLHGCAQSRSYFLLGSRRCTAPQLATAAQPSGSSGHGGQVPAASSQAKPETAPPPAQQQPYSLVEERALAGGKLHLVRLDGDRMLRVWLPPGYDRAHAAQRLYPLLLLLDGQNLFDDALSFSGHSWRAAQAAAQLIADGEAPPFLLAGIDHVGADRSYEYLPYPPGAGPGGFRQDAASWPGGGAAAFCDRVFGQIVPWLQREYGAAADPARIALGGSSFGGICTLYACMHHAGRFGAALVESPSMWIAQERFLREDLPAYAGPWPQRIFLAMGTREYRGICSDQEAAAAGAAVEQWDAMLVRYCCELVALLERQGLDASRLRWVVQEGAAHTEAAWAERLPAALCFLLAAWRDAP